MKKVLNTLYVQTQGAYLRLDHETLVMEVEGSKNRQMPLHPIGGIVVIGNIMVSPHLIAKCSSEGKGISFFTPYGRFQYRVEGPISGNVLLRCAQHDAQRSSSHAASISKSFAAGKIRNSRSVLLRGGRDAAADDDKIIIGNSATELGRFVNHLERAEQLDEIRGIEGASASSYFRVFRHLLRDDKWRSEFKGRTRRPPRDKVNAVLSYLYTLLRFDCESALEGVGLDPQVGYLHSLRPGRPSLALDLMEELRPIFADRLTLTLFNRSQLSDGDFDERPGGAVYLNDDGRKTVITAWQNRKDDEVTHPVLKKKVPYALIPHIQSRLLARHIRGDIEAYPPFLWR